MLSNSFLLLAAALAAISSVEARPKSNPLVLHEHREKAPAGFVSSHLPHADEELTLRFHLKKADRDGMIKKLHAVSTPGHAEYGKHISRTELETFVRPSKETTETVTQWLKAEGLVANEFTTAGDILTVKVPVGKANQLLGAQYQSFAHAESNTTMLRTLSYSLPENIRRHVTTVDPTTSFGRIQRGSGQLLGKWKPPVQVNGSHNHTVDKRQDACQPQITPLCLRQLYGMPDGLGAGSGKSSLAIGGFLNQFAQQTDLDQFLGTHRQDVGGLDFNTQLLEDGQNPQDAGQAGVEANLDIQFSAGIVGQKMPVWFISVGGGGDGNGFYNILKDFLAQDDVPMMLSVSYGQGEPGLSPDLANEMCDAFAQLGTRGVSVLYASGDSGVGGKDGGGFEPTFPSGCPYLTSVGATDGYNPERVAGFSSGGFSTIFPVPDFQKDAVNNYLGQIGDQNSGHYNAGGRGFPDVAAQGTNVPIVNGGGWTTVGGTSASAPIFTSIIALLNDELLAAGKQQLGWLNPWLYANPGAFNDITEGTNAGSNTIGFDAKGGWDPATGLGTPNYGALRTAAGL